MKIFDIGEIADRSGIPPSTLRYYEDSGLITSVARHGLRRQFGPETLPAAGVDIDGKGCGLLAQGNIGDVPQGRHTGPAARRPA